MSFGKSHLVKSVLVTVALAVAAVVGTAAPASAAHRQARAREAGFDVGAVFSETNDPTNNQVVAFGRRWDGTLEQRQVVATGGKGGQEQQPGCTAMCPILDTQSELTLSPDRRFLFVVNAGSNTISTFWVTPFGLILAQTTPSGGVFPNSLTTHGNVLYALNANSDNIAGFRIGWNGTLTPIAGSDQPLSAGALPGLPRQIGFDKTGRVLAVTLLATASGPPPIGTTSGVIDTFPVGQDGTAGPATANDSSTPFPFAFSFDPFDRLVAAQITSLTTPGLGDAATYRLTGSGAVTPIDTEATGGEAPCWTAITPDGRFVYEVNTGGGAGPAEVAEFRLLLSGKLVLLGATPDLGEFAKTDEVLSADGRDLYVLSPALTGPTSHIDEYSVGFFDGTLRLIGQTSSTLPPGMSGLTGF
jgi:6-phosphogluconolactonase